jgi:hypothetical protein
MITDRLSRASDIAPESGSKTLDSKVQNSLPPARLVQTVIGALAVRDTATSLTGETIVLRRHGLERASPWGHRCYRKNIVQPKVVSSLVVGVMRPPARRQ